MALEKYFRLYVIRFRHHVVFFLIASTTFMFIGLVFFFFSHPLYYNVESKIYPRESEKRVSIVVPIFKEASNIRRLVERISNTTQTLKITYEIVLVDDDSRDGTIEIVKQLSEEEKLPIRLIVRKEDASNGLSTAVLEGLHRARYPVAIVMDADLSHPPEAFPYLIEPIWSGKVPITFGSRFVRGGKIEGWSLFRLVQSKVASFLASFLTDMSDPMSGYFCVDRTLILPLEDRCPGIRPRGFKIGLELLVRCSLNPVLEVPITFRNRILG